MEMIRCPGCMKKIPAGTACEYCGFDGQTANAAHQLAIGTILKEQYQIGKVLGQGGFGITYLGWDLYLDIPVAIKEYYPSGTVMRENAVTMSVTDISGDEGVRFRNNRDRFMREAKMLARFSQVPEIVQVRNFFLANNTAYIVMEYVEGITLKQYVKDQGGRLTVAETMEILGPMIRTLDKVHRTGIIHRDISPDNIMMIPGGAKLLDFGAVRSVSGSVGQELTRSTESILKQGYAPIEQYQKRGALGPWTDVYALCATICYCLTGEVPPDAPARMLDYEDVDLGGIADLTPAQRQALAHGMALRADERTASMEQLYQELLSMEPLPAPEPEPEPEPKSVHEPKPEPMPVTKLEPKPEPEPKPESRKPDAGKNSNFWLILGVAVLAVVLVVGAMLLDKKDSERAEIPAQVSENQITGECGIDCRWMLDLDTGVMTLTGNLMGDFYLEEYDAGMREGASPQPWAQYRDSIREVVLDGDFVRVGTAAFAHCTNLSKVTLNDKLWEIGMDAFRNTGITGIQLPQTLRTIEAFAFCETAMREVVLPVQVDAIGREAFGLCPDLWQVEIQGSSNWNLDIRSGKPVFSREGHSLEGLTLRGPEGGIVEIYANALGYIYQSNGNQVNFEGEGDFSAYPGKVQGSWRFDAESGLLYIAGEMPEDMKGQWEMDVKDPQRMRGRENLLMAPWWKYREQLRVVYIEEGVTRICDNAFANMNMLRSIHMPDSLRSIGFQSFLDTGLEEVYIPDSVTEIRAYAFNYCQSLVTARMPIGLAKLEQGVFNACPMLKHVYAGSQTEFVHYEENGYPITPFTNSPSPEGHLDETLFPANVTLFTPAGQQDAKVKEFAEEFGLNYRTGVYGHEEAEVTGEMLAGDSSLYWALENGTLYLMGRGETPYYRSGNIDRNAWHTMQQGYRTISNEAPWYPYRNEIHTVIVEPGITVLNRGILVNMPNLNHVDLGTVEKLYDGAIENCGITQLNLPDSLVHVHKGAIRDCIDLKVIHIGSGSEKLDHGMIQGCGNLQELWFWSGKEKIHEAFDLFDGKTPMDLVIHARHDSEGSYYAQRSGIAYEKIP